MKFFGMGGLELVIILVIVLIIFGPKNLPKLGKAIGRGVNGLKKGVESGKEKIDEKFDEVEAERADELSVKSDSLEETGEQSKTTGSSEDAGKTEN